MLLLPTTYFGNIEYFSKIIDTKEATIEIYESYPKQTYRNRCMIMSANGVIPIIVPTKHSKGVKLATKDVEIDYSMPWQRNAWRAIVSAYRNSAYFEHYEHLLEPLFVNRYETLLEMNNTTLDVMLKTLKVSPSINFTSDYIRKDSDSNIIDLRDSFSPKKESDSIDTEYYQVFSDRHPFAKNLSILDLILCEGSNSLNILK